MQQMFNINIFFLYFMLHKKRVCINSVFDYFYSFYIEGFIQLADEGLLCTSGLLRPTRFSGFDLRALHQFYDRRVFDG